MNCAEYFVKFLVEKGVTDIFGYPGGYILPFMEALNKNPDIKVHLCYNEQGCAFSAIGFSRMSGSLGVYFTTSGPGAVNAMAGLADAWFDGIPIMGICGNVPLKERKGSSNLRQYGFQEMDIVSVVRPITKYAETVSNSKLLMDIIETAFENATSGRKGGVLIDFPFDIQEASTDSR